MIFLTTTALRYEKRSGDIKVIEQEKKLFIPI